MYAHIDGTLSEKLPDALVIDCAGVGYLLVVSRTTLAAAPGVGERMKCHVRLSVREDAMELFGFATRDERTMFDKLCAVSGVGARTALNLLSTLTVRDLSVALVTGDINALARAPGIGKKLAQRLALELREKVDNAQLTGMSDAVGVGASAVPAGPTGEAVEALVMLGFTPGEAARAVAQVAAQAETADEMVRLALRGMGGK